MFIHRETRRLLRQKHVNPNLLWERILRTAIVSNGYPETLKIRVLMDLNVGDHKDLLVVAGELSSTVYDDYAEHYRMHQLSALIRKYPGLNLEGIDPLEKTLKVFYNAEWRSKWTNRKFALINRHGLPVEASAIHRMRTYVSYVLRNKQDRDEDGPAPTPDMERIFSQCAFTGGASLGVHGNATNLLRKLAQHEDGGFTCTQSAFSLVAEAMWENHHIREFILAASGSDRAVKEGMICYDEREFIKALKKSVQLVCHNKVAFADKDATVKRTVASEPTLTTYLLKGVDLELRALLRRAGLDLSDQGPNAIMAYMGSRDWESDDPYCTIDLTSASAMLAVEVVRTLLPPEWFELLNKCRAEYFELPDGTTGRYQQFASMGNGSVFPLQTLIFASVCHAAYSERGEAPDFRVYGDDIIVRKRVFDRVIALLRFLGFKPNKKKTFSEGPFRESCGADWHNGQDVRPVFLDHALETPDQIFGFHNQSLRRSRLVFIYFTEIRELLYEELPRLLRFVTDYDPGVLLPNGKTIDGAFWVPIDRVMASPLCFYNRQTYSWAHTVCQAEAIEDELARLDRAGGGVSGVVKDYATLMAALVGSSSNNTFTMRYTKRLRAVIKNRSVPLPDDAMQNMVVSIGA